MCKRKTKKTGVQTPEFRKSTPPPPPSRGLRVNAMLYDDGIAPCVDCKKHKIDTEHCLICWAHNFNSFEAKEN